MILNILRTFVVALIFTLIYSSLDKKGFKLDKRIILSLVITASWLLLFIGFSRNMFESFTWIEEGFNDFTGYKGAYIWN